MSEVDELLKALLRDMETLTSIEFMIKKINPELKIAQIKKIQEKITAGSIFNSANQGG